MATETASESRRRISRRATRPKVPEMMYTWVWSDTLLPCKAEKVMRAIKFFVCVCKLCGNHANILNFVSNNWIAVYTS